MVRSPLPKDRPTRSLICTWLTPPIWYSTGSSRVTTLMSGRITETSPAYSEEVLPDPVGPVMQDQSLRLGEGPLDHLAVTLVQPDLGQGLGLLGLLAQQPDDDRLAVHGRHGRDPGVGLLPVQLDAAAAVLGLAPLGDVHARQDLDPGDQRPLDRLGDHRDLAQQPVDAVADPDVALLGLDVDVGGPAVQASPMMALIRRTTGASSTSPTCS